MRKSIPILVVLSAVAFATITAATHNPMRSVQSKLDGLIKTVDSLSHKLTQHEETLNKHKSAMDGVSNSVNALTTKVDALGKTVITLNSTVNHQDSLLNNQQNAVDALKRQMAAHIPRVGRDEAKLHNLSRDVAHHGRVMPFYAKSVERLNNSTKSLDHRVIENTNKVDMNIATYNNLNNKANSQATQLVADEAKINNVSSSVNTHNWKIDSIQRTLTSHDTRIHQHETKIATDSSKIDTLTKNMTATKKVTDTLGKTLSDVGKTVGENENKVKSEGQTMESIGNQLMQQQTFVEERIRSDGMSGIKSLRHIHEGTQPYYGDTHIGGSALSAHDHADYDRTIGLGEFVAVMNGVEFRTRHNDYKFKKPTSTRTFNSVEDVPFPDVPPQVTSKKTLNEKIVEMRKWFKAFKDQDHSVRDYRKYFKANLCYLEGGWTLNAKTLSEPFDSDRHHIDAASWFDLQEKIRFTSYSGSKSNLENFAYLPTTMYNYTNGIPQIAQWNYRIVCHPLKQDVPTNYFDLQDDLTTRMARKYTWDRMPNMRAARYKLNEFGTDRGSTVSFLDRLMYEIPGKDNYGNNLTDNAVGLLHYELSTQSGADKPLSAGYYHRWYKLQQKGAMGVQVNHRGYRDENMWVALTTQPNIMPLSYNRCYQGHCNKESIRVTYAIPLEIVYSTPLQSWNPLNLNFDKDTYAVKDGRNGGLTPATAYNGTSFKHYYRTPVDFYKDGATEKDAADTARSAVGVLDKNGHMQKAAPTGFRIMTPDIQDVGSVRIRYPIFPVHSEGSTVGEEIGALKKMLMQMSRSANLFETPPVGTSSATQQSNDVDVDFEVRESARNPPGLHGHDFTLTASEYKSILNGTHIKVTTSYNLGHNHELEIYYNKGNHNFYITKCDGQSNCWDGHSHSLRKV